MNTSTDFDAEPESQLRRLVAEIVAQTPSANELSSVRLSNPDRRGSSMVSGAAPSAPRVAAAAALLVIAAAVGWWLAPSDTTTVATQVPVGEQPYRWKATFPQLNEQFSLDGAIDPAAGWYRFRWQHDSELLEFIYDDDIVGSRYEGNGDLVGLDEEQAAEISGTWYLLEGGDTRGEFQALLADVTTLDMFEVDDWEDLGSEKIDGTQTQRVRTASTPGPKAQESLSGLVSIFAVEWNGLLDVWVREDGRVNRIVLYGERQNELVESARVEFYDFGVPIGTTWPDGEPPTKRFPD